MAETIVLLHGFAGTRRTWDPVIARLGAERYRPLALDLHATTFAACTEAVLAAAPPRFALAGYSLGGRIALHVALAAPERVDRLVLISTTAGIEDATERDGRRARDEALADRVERETIEDFAAHWRAQPLFADDPPAVAALAAEDYRRHAPADLAASLRGIGTGAMTPLWDRLGELTMPATIVAGERDAKFRALGERLRTALPAAELIVVPGAGHAVHLEDPAATARAILGPAAR